MSYGKIIDQIDNNQPQAARIGWKNGGGHALVIRGYYEDTSEGQQDVYYKDPLPDEPNSDIMAYDDFVDNADWEWTHTLYNICVD